MVKWGGMCGEVACVVRGVCMVKGVCRAKGVCMPGGIYGREGACVAGETATTADGKHLLKCILVGYVLHWRLFLKLYKGYFA